MYRCLEREMLLVKNISDHKPLWGLYLTARRLSARHVRMQRPPPRTEVNRSDKRLIPVFQERMLDMLHQLPPPGATQDTAELDMECLTQFTVQLVKEVTDKYKPSGRRSTSYKNSPEFMLRKRHLCLVISLKRLMCGLHGKSKWSLHHQVTKGIQYMYTTLRAHAASMGMKDDMITRILRSSGGGEEFWAQVPLITGVVCDDQIAKHRKALHGRKRLEMRKASSCYASWVEQMREQGKAGKVIKAVRGVHAGRNHQDGLVMDSISRNTGEVIGDLAINHQEITDMFREHYAMPLDFEMHCTMHRTGNRTLMTRHY